MDHQLHSTAFIEKSFGDDSIFAGHRTERALDRREYIRRLVRRRDDRASIRVHQHRYADRRDSAISSRRRDTSVRKLARAAGRFAAPERNRRRRAMRIFHAHAAGLDAADTPGRRSEQKHIAGHALHREIFVERSDHRAFRLHHHLILRRFRNRAAGGDRHQPRAAPPAHAMIHLIAMQIALRAARARSRCLRTAFRAPHRSRGAPESRYG